MSVGFNVDSKAFFAQLSDREKRQLPQALKETVYKVTLDRQRRLKQHVGSVLTIRSGRTAFLNAIRFEDADRPTKDRPTATLRVYNGPVETSGPGGKADAFRRFGAILTRQDAGEVQTSDALYRQSGNKGFTTGGFIIPAPGRRGPKGAMKRDLYPINTGLTPYAKIEGGKYFTSQYKGGKYKRKAGFKPDTRFYFVKENVGIFLREQIEKKSKYSAVWFFRRRINIPRRVKLKETFLEGLPAQIEQTFAVEFGRAMSTAR